MLRIFYETQFKMKNLYTNLVTTNKNQRCSIDLQVTIQQFHTLKQHGIQFEGKEYSKKSITFF